MNIDLACGIVYISIGCLNDPGTTGIYTYSHTLSLPDSLPISASPSASPPPASPWEHSLWHNATTAMRLYVCDHARRPPNWCAEEAERPVVTALPDPQGPLRTPEDAAWQSFLETEIGRAHV